MAFDRWVVNGRNSFAFDEFRRHHTELNNLYWSFVPVASYSSFVARRSSESVPAAVFHASGPDVIRLTHSKELWTEHFKEFQNWVRLGIVMSAASYFELYVRSIAALALLSDPYGARGATRLVDGVKLLKLGVSTEIDGDVTACVKGAWSTRAAAFRRLFGAVPGSVSSNLAQLEAIRKVRNQVGHAFGREIPSAWGLVKEDLSGVARVSERTAKTWLKVLHEVALEIDGYLLNRSIGEFELLLDYHLWRKQARKPSHKGLPEEAAFAKWLAMRSPGRRVLAGLISYYDAL